MIIHIDENVSCLYNALKDRIKDCVVYELSDINYDFEYEIHQDNNLISKHGFASQVKLPIYLDGNYKTLKVNITSGLFTEVS